jgi:60S ribosomal subunit assembly/export protein LOC1
MMRILYTVTENVDSRNASKLEKARQLEAIREAKRVEMEKKEQERSSKLENKKREIKQAKRNKGKKNAPATPVESASDADGSKKKKKVSFA